MTAQPLETRPTTGHAGEARFRLDRTGPAVAWATQVVVAVILAQTLVFKFTYAPETRFIFESRGGRPAATAVGLAELLCVVLLLVVCVILILYV